MLTLEVLQGQQAGRRFVLPDTVITLGRGVSATVQLTDFHLSGEHATVFFEEDQYIFRDLRSTNGSMVLRGHRRIAVDGSERWELPLRDGDRLALGDPATPVILVCHIDLPEVAAEDPRVLARKAPEELPAVAHRLESDPSDLATLYQAMKRVGSSGLELSRVLSATAQSVLDVVPRASHISVLLADDEADRFTPVHSASREGGSAASLRTSRTVLRRVLEERAAVLVSNAPEELSGSESIMGAQIMSTIGAPLWHGAEIRGVIQVDNRASLEVFDERDLDRVTVLASLASLAIDNARMVQRLRVAEQQVREEVSFLKERTLKRSFSDIIGESASMKAIFHQLTRVIDTRATIHIEGETGTGKELVASAIHYQGRRRDKLFVAANCAALPENLLESELFGHKKGSFTGADRDSKGLFAVADGGTLFLDEIAEMSIPLQAKLLRVLQEGEIRPVGATRSQNVDVRIISATNKSLEEEVERGRFRQDLYYRLHVFPIRLPPLRERREDIPLLARHFLVKYTAEIKKDVAGFSQGAMDQLVGHTWPGNVRELENEVQRLVITCDEGGFIQPEHLSQRIRQVEGLVDRIGPRQGTLREMMEQVERYILRESLREHEGNKTRTAVTLGITREGLHKKLAKYGM
ncbi:MAG: sigma 54-interacting transcriptional regulator [Polyangia bacterium]|jgi:Nif-specific regulatory protein|nr:sigma 54-interacting transcriptional regulator [Polyangia bacterium]